MYFPKELLESCRVGPREMHEFWVFYRGNQDVERLLLEVQCSRNVISGIDDCLQFHISRLEGSGPRPVGRDGEGPLHPGHAAHAAGALSMSCQLPRTPDDEPEMAIAFLVAPQRRPVWIYRL
jgi:hypothetical protein